MLFINHYKLYLTRYIMLLFVLTLNNFNWQDFIAIRYCTVLKSLKEFNF